MNECIQAFQEHGYVMLRNVIPMGCLDDIKQELKRILTVRNSDPASLESAISNAELRGHQGVYNASITVGSSLAAYRLIYEARIDAYAAMAVFGYEKGLHVTPLHCDIQLPRDDRFVWAWHVESDFYPWAPAILNCWFPILSSTLRGVTGTIEIIPKSHLKERRQHDKPIGNTKFVAHVSKAEEAMAIEVEAEPGDLLLFHQDLVHRSVSNLSNVPRVTGILRVIDQSVMKESRPLYKALSYVE